jgi:hypothetical protein
MNPSELSQDPRHRKVRKRAIPVYVTFAEERGTLKTLEGPVPFEVGDAIVTGSGGEHWPVPRNRFLDRYDASISTEVGKDGSYTPRPKVVSAMQVTTEDGPVKITTDSGGVLTAKAGDWVVQYDSDEFGVVAPDIFEETYEEVP